MRRFIVTIVVVIVLIGTMLYMGSCAVAELRGVMHRTPDTTRN